jgi:hypothetical protein
MTQQGRKIRFELTPLEAEAVFAAAAMITENDGKAVVPSWPMFIRRRGAGTAKSALLRALDKIGSEISRQG